MEKIINFLIENYRLIVDAIAVIVAVIFFLIKKKPINIIDSNKSMIENALPTIINMVEVCSQKNPLSSSEKLSLADQLVIDYIRANIGEDYLKGFDIGSINVLIEKILSTPQKKGEK